MEKDHEALQAEALRLEVLKREAIGIAGTKTQLAKQLGVCRQAVTKWFLYGGKMTHANVVNLERWIKAERKKIK